MQNLVSKKEEEERRLKALAEYRILGTKPESCYDDITKIAATTCNVPISLMTLVDKDKQWFKSKIGLQISETRRDWSFCTHAIKENSPLIIHDAFQDERFINNPLVTGDPKIRFYAGFPLRNSDGNKLGTLCVIDRKPGNLTTQQFNIMELKIYIFLFLILFLGVIFNLKITNFKKVKEIRNKAKDYSKKNN